MVTLYMHSLLAKLWTSTHFKAFPHFNFYIEICTKFNTLVILQTAEKDKTSMKDWDRFR